MEHGELKQLVKEKYGKAAARATSGAASCCGPSSCGTRGARDPITANLYEARETADLPAEALAASLGCGNPTALAALSPGEVVLDLGSGGGIDVLLSAKRVGPTGKAYGLDITDEMLALARENQRKAGVANVEFLKGEIEAIPLPDDAVDVIISNCVINLSADKDRVLAEAFRVLKPGGRFAVSDIVVRGDVPAPIRRSVELWIGCVAGALEEGEYRDKLAKAGFEAIEIEPTRVYRVEDAREFLAQAGLDAATVASQVDEKFMSAFVRARKPVGGAVVAGRMREGRECEAGGISVKTVLFACTHNAGRSQMAAAFFNTLADPAKARAVSAGTDPSGRVHPEVLAVMREVGLDLSAARPRRLTAELAGGAQWLVTMGCGEACPVVPGAHREDWPLEDPKGQPLERVRAIRDQIRHRVEKLAAAEGWARKPHP